MSKASNKYFKDFEKSFPADKMQHAAFVQLVRTYSQMCAEEDILQQYVDENGITYETETRDGTILHKLYPQHGQLAKLRTQKTATFRTLIKYIRDEEEADAGEELLR
jgi:hypothetical protein